MNILAELKNRFRIALSSIADDPDALLDMIRASQDPRFGDYQANCAMPLGKQLGQPPRQIAEQIVAALDVADICEPPEIAGPGFINLRVQDAWLIEQLKRAAGDARLGVPMTSEPRTFVVDYSSPNVAKPMHVGHIRSTVIGDALGRTLRFLGHNVISDNHLGDWGTQFGMIIYGYRHFRDDEAYQRNPVEELSRVYRLVRQIMDYYEGGRKLPVLEEKTEAQSSDIEQRESAPPTGDKGADKKAAKELRKLKSKLGETQTESVALKSKLATMEADVDLIALINQHADIESAVLDETAKLHEGDADNLDLWREFLPHCRADIQRIYDRLDIRFDEELGESFYHDRLAAVVEDFQKKGLARESDGAICVFLDEFDAPMIIRKRDGAFLYATTDLATIAYRLEKWNPDAILYVVDFRQGEHFGKLFAAASLWGREDIELTHVSFGTVLGDDGKPFKTRSGDTVNLEGLLDEAVRRAREVVGANDDAKPGGRELTDETRDHVAEVVGLAALKYADLSHNRTSDYEFSYDKMLAMNGNTATYMQYAYARVRNIFARGGIEAETVRSSVDNLDLAAPEERALGLELVRFSQGLQELVADYRPNQLTNYLFGLANCYSSFYEKCHVLKADNDAVRNSRLLLCDLTARTIKQGLALLGIDVIEKM